MIKIEYKLYKKWFSILNRRLYYIIIRFQCVFSFICVAYIIIIINNATRRVIHQKQREHGKYII